MRHDADLPSRRSRLLADAGAACAIIVALCSLGMTIYEARATREHDRVSVWPRIYQTVSDSAHRYIRTVTNVGVGPAIIRSFEVQVDGVAKHSWAEVTQAALQVGQQPLPRMATFYSAFGKGSVLLPGAHLDLLTISSDTLSGRLVAVEHRIRSSACYCSVYDECWIARSDTPDPERVAKCDDKSAEDFSR